MGRSSLPTPGVGASPTGRSDSAARACDDKDALHVEYPHRARTKAGDACRSGGEGTKGCKEATMERLNQLPIGDGAVGLYLWRALEGKAPSANVRKVVFVNGMQTTPEQYRLGAWFVSEVTESYVVGVYNLVGFAGYLYSRRQLPNADVSPR